MASPRPPLIDSQVRVLFVGLDTLADKPIGLRAEIDAIEAELAAADVGGALPFHADPEGNVDTLHSALLAAPRAEVLHFSGHGHAVKGLAFEDAEGRPFPVSGEQLARLLGRFRNLRLVVLAACHQRHQAAALCDLFDCVVGTDGRMPVDASRQFVRAFYKGLANGDSVGRAFETAKARIEMEAPEVADQFFLSARQAIDPNWVVLTPVRRPAPSLRQLEAGRASLLSRVNPADDVVLHANVKDWRDAVPYAPGSAPHAISIWTPERGGGWHRQWPPNRGEWARAAASVRAAAALVREGSWKRVHCVVQLPYGLGALLASSLEAMNHEVIFHQYSPPPGRPQGQKTWQIWGPGAADALPPPDNSPVFNAVNWPDEPRERFTGDIALVVAATWPIAPKLVHAAAGDRHRIRLYQLMPQRDASQASLDQSNIGRAAGQLAEAVQKASALFPNARGIHLFVAAPLVLVMRAAFQLHHCPVPVIIHEFFRAAEPEPCYLPMLDLQARAVVAPDDVPR